jgi:hypothetical protein
VSIPHAVLPAPIPSADSVRRAYLPTDLEHPSLQLITSRSQVRILFPPLNPRFTNFVTRGLILSLAETIPIWPTYPKLWQEFAMYACGGLSLLFANRDTRVARRQSLFGKSLDFWREPPRRLYGRDKKFENLFGQRKGFELFRPRFMSARQRRIPPH